MLFRSVSQSRYIGIGGLAGILSGVASNPNSASALKDLRDFADKFYDSGGNLKY